MKGGRAALGLFIVSLGLIALLNNLGLVGWTSWLFLGRLWPVLLIFLGLQLFTGRPALVWGLLVWLALGLGWYFAAGGISQGYGPEPRLQHKLPLNVQLQEQVEEAALQVRFGAGKLVLDTAPGRQLVGSLTYRGGEPQINIRQEGRQAEVFLQPAVQGTWSIFDLGSGPLYQWQVSLPTAVAWDLALDVGAASGTLNLVDLDLRSLTLKTGASDLEVSLGRPQGEIPVNLEVGAAHLTLVIPTEAEARIQWTGGASSNNLQAAGFSKRADSYFTPGYSGSPHHYDITVKAGAASLEVIRK